MLLLASEGLWLLAAEGGIHLGPRRGLVQSRPLGGAGLLGPNPAGLHVHGRRRHAVRAGGADGSRREPTRTTSGTSSCVPSRLALLSQILVSVGSGRIELQMIVVLSQIAFTYFLSYLIIQVEVALAGGDRRGTAGLSGWRCCSHFQALTGRT